MSGRRRKFIAALTAELVRAGKPANVKGMTRWWRRQPAPERARWARRLGSEGWEEGLAEAPQILLPERLAGKGRGFRWR